MSHILFNEMDVTKKHTPHHSGRRVRYSIFSDENPFQAFQPADFFSILLGGHLVFLCPSVGVTACTISQDLKV